MELGEVESALTAVTGLRAAVVPWPIGAVGAEGLVGFVEGAADLEGARRALAERLPPALVPRRLLSVPELPTNSRGKLDRAALTALAREP